MDNTALCNGEHFPVDLDAKTLENFACILCDRFEASCGEGKYCGACT